MIRRKRRRRTFTTNNSEPVTRPREEKLKLPRYQLIDAYDTTRFRTAMSWFMQTFEALFTHLVEKRDEEIEVKRRKRVVWTARKICEENIGVKTCEVVNFYSAGMERDLLIRNLLRAELVKRVKQVKYGYLDEDYDIRRRRFVEREMGLYVGNKNEEVTLAKTFAVFKKSKPRCVLFRRTGPQDTPFISLFAPKKDLDDAVKWFWEVRREHSPLRGRAVMIAMDGMNITSGLDRVTWEDLVPRENIMAEFDLLERSLTSPEEFEDKGLNIKRGILFAGPPGTGKTLHVDLLITIAIEHKVPVFIVRGLPGNLTIGNIYKQAQEIGPALVILEDIDTVAKDRDAPFPTGSMSVLQELLNVLDGTEVIDRVVTVATTNMVDRLDRALAARPGRFDASYRFGYPSRDERIAVYKLHARELKVNLPATRAFATAEGKELLEKEGVTHSHIHGILETMAKNRAARNGKSKLIDLFKEAVRAGENLINPDPKYQEMIPQMGFQVGT